MLWGPKAKTARKPLNDSPPGGRSLTYNAKRMRITQPTHGGFALEPLDDGGESLGIFEFAVGDGWRCGEGAFFHYAKRTIGGEGTWSGEVSIERLFRTSEGGLGRSIEIWHDKRSMLTFGAPFGAAEKIIDVQHRFELVR